jgi:hypothetical protein
VSFSPLDDCDYQALCEIPDTWERRDFSYERRIRKMRTGQVGLNSSMVFADGAADLMTGAAADDWVFAGVKDKITDRKNSESVV